MESDWEGVLVVRADRTIFSGRGGVAEGAKETLIGLLIILGSDKYRPTYISDYWQDCFRQAVRWTVLPYYNRVIWYNHYQHKTKTSTQKPLRQPHF